METLPLVRMNPEPSTPSGIKRKMVPGDRSLMTPSGRNRERDERGKTTTEKGHGGIEQFLERLPAGRRRSGSPGPLVPRPPAELSYPGRRGDRCWSTGRSRRQSSRICGSTTCAEASSRVPGGSPGVGRHACVRAQDPVGVRPVQRRARERPTKRRRSARRTWTRLDTVAEKGTQKHKSPTVSGTVGLQHFGSCGGRI